MPESTPINSLSDDEKRAEEPPIKWTGDLEDDCTTEPWNGLIGRAECMGEITFESEGDTITTTYWYVGVYRGVGPSSDPNDTVYHDQNTGGMICTGARAREVAELAMRAEAYRSQLSAAQKLDKEKGEEVERLRESLASHDREMLYDNRHQIADDLGDANGHHHE